MSVNSINKKLLAIFCALLLLSGCSMMGYKDDKKSSRRPADRDLVAESHATADALLEQVPWLKSNRQPLLTGTIVDVNSLEDSSALGRIVADQISSRFAQQGFTMIELRLRNNVFVKQRAGEFMLSREAKNLSKVHNAGAVIAGTYAVGRNEVYVSARLIRAADNLVIAAHDYTLPLGPNTRALVASQ